MARKSRYDQLVDAISKRLDEMAPENCATIEESVANDAKLSKVLGMVPTSAADYSLCSGCGRVCWHGVCQVCK